MKIARLYASPSGESRFQDIDIVEHEFDKAVAKPGFPGDLVFCEVGVDDVGEWKPATAGHYLVLLEGDLEIESSSGERRAFGAGSVILIEDTIGQGHRVHLKSNRTCRAISIRLSEANARDIVDQVGRDSFPASDAPGWSGTTLS